MKSFLLVLLLPIQLLAQKPVRHYDFISRKQTGLYTGEFSISPQGSFLLATFNDFDKRAVYELVNVSTGKLISSGELPGIPNTIAWRDDERMIAINFRRMSPVCYAIEGGLKKLFATSTPGEPAFSRNTQLLSSGFSPELFIFGDENIYRYTAKGVLTDSVETDDFASYEGAWFDVLRNRFVLTEYGVDKISGYSVKDRILQPIAGGVSDGSSRQFSVAKDGALFLHYDDHKLYIHQSGDGKRLTSYSFTKISAACFSPDGKYVLVTDQQQVGLLNMQGKLVKSVPRPAYYSHLGYGLFGKEIVMAHPDGFDVYNSQDYFFAKDIPVVNKPPVVTNPAKTAPVKEKTVPLVKDKPWSLPYRIRDFITPFDKDSFYLYSKDRGLRYFIRYEKAMSGILTPIGFHYSQFFGFSKDAKYQLLNFYLLDMTDSTACLGTYSRSGLIEKPAMVGGRNFFAQISATPGKTISWPMNVFDEQYTLSAKLIDYVYKGKKGKCITVTRDDPKNNVNETWYYQQGVGLIRIDSDQQIAFERL